MSKKVVYAPGEWFQAKKRQFIEEAFKANPQAHERLANSKNADDLEIAAAEWARSYSVEGTWVEQWALLALLEWNALVSLAPFGEVRLILPSIPEDPTPSTSFRFSIEAFPEVRVAQMNVIGGRRFDDIPDCNDDLERFEKQARHAFESELQHYLGSVRESGLYQSVPDELDIKLKIAARYLFAGQSPAKLMKDKPERWVGQRSTLNRWIKDTLRFLKIPMKKPGQKKRG